MFFVYTVLPTLLSQHRSVYDCICVLCKSICYYLHYEPCLRSRLHLLISRVIVVSCGHEPSSASASRTCCVSVAGSRYQLTVVCEGLWSYAVVDVLKFASLPRHWSHCRYDVTYIICILQIISEDFLFLFGGTVVAADK